MFCRTGARVRESSEGDVVFTGRQDRQFTIRGFGVESDEIEAALDGIAWAALVSVVNGDTASQLNQSRGDSGSGRLL